MSTNSAALTHSWRQISSQEKPVDWDSSEMKHPRYTSDPPDYMIARKTSSESCSRKIQKNIFPPRLALDGSRVYRTRAYCTTFKATCRHAVARARSNSCSRRVLGTAKKPIDTHTQGHPPNVRSSERSSSETGRRSIAELHSRIFAKSRHARERLLFTSWASSPHSS